MTNEWPRRILMTTDTVGGVWTFTIQLAEELSRFGIEVVLASLGGHPNEAQQRQTETVPLLHLLSSNFKLEWMENPWDDVEASCCWLLSLEETHQPDMIHLNSFGHGALPWQRPVILTAHSCVMSWWDAVRAQTIPCEWDRYRQIVRRALISVDRIAAPSHAMAETLNRNYVLNPTAQPIDVIPNGLRPDRFRIGRKEPFVLTAGRLWDEGKNASAVTTAAGHISWPVYLAGDSTREGSIPAEDRGCHLLGRLSQEELAQVYSRASIYALPARYEPFGLSALEAALSGCALVLGDIPSLREIWADTALYVHPDKPGELASTLQELIDDPQLRQELARQSRQRALQFTAERMAAHYLALYRSVGKESYACAS